MKATNNINLDLKEEIGRLLDKSTKLQISVDDQEETLRDEIKKAT